MRGDGIIYGRSGTDVFWCKYYLRGKPFYESTGETDETRAKKFLKRRLIEVGADQMGIRPFVTPQNQRASIASLLNAVESDYKMRGIWTQPTASHTKIVREQFGLFAATSLNTDHVRKFITEGLQAGLTNGTLNKRLQLLRRALVVAVREGKLANAPYIPRLSEVGSEREGFFETDQFEKVVQHLPDYLQDLTRYVFKCGWRKGAVVALEWEHVREDEILLVSANSKSRKPVTIPIDDELQEVIERRRAAQVYEAKDGTTTTSKYVFHRRGKPIGGFRKAWASACCAAGVGKMVCQHCGRDEFEKLGHKKPAHGPTGSDLQCTHCQSKYKSRDRLKYIGKLFHDFRRTAARNMVKGGVPTHVAMQITGHTTDSMFRRYAIVDQEQKRDALEKARQYATAAPKRKVLRFGQ